MSEENNDHYRYMPPGSVPQHEERPVEVPEGGDGHVGTEEEIYEVAGDVRVVAEDADGFTQDREEELEEASGPKKGDGFFDGSVPVVFKVLYGFFSPFLVPTFVSLFIFLLSVLVLVVPEATAPYTLTVFGATCVVPLIALYVLMKVGAVESFQLFSPRERFVPYVIEILALGGTTLFFLFKGANPWIWAIFCGGTAVALVNLLINFKMRVSCHCSALAALVAALIVINRHGIPQVSLFWWMVGALIVAGFIGTMAIVYGRHNVREVLVGYATGFLGVILFSLIR